MKMFVPLLKTDLYRVFSSFYFVTTMLSILLVMFISSSGYFNMEQQDVISLLGSALSGSGSLLFIVCIAPIFPYGMSYALDYEERNIPFWAIRTGNNAYISSKFVTAALMGFLSVFLSILLFTCILSFFFPFSTHITSGNSYVTLLENNKPISYVFILAIHYGLSAAIIAGAAVSISTLIPDKFSVIVAPVVVYFVLIRLTAALSIPNFLRPNELIEGVYPGVTPLNAFLVKLIPTVGVLFLLLMMANKLLNKRMGIK